MDLPFASLISAEKIEMFLALPFAEAWLVAGILGLTASIYATGVPGALLPISFSSGALLGETLGMAAVTCGALAGSLVLYAVLKRTPINRLHDRFGHHIQRIEGLASNKGILAISGLRIAGMPHLAVTALCALASVGPRRYAVATSIGLFPIIALSATAGAAI